MNLITQSQIFIKLKAASLVWLGLCLFFFCSGFKKKARMLNIYKEMSWCPDVHSSECSAHFSVIRQHTLSPHLRFTTIWSYHSLVHSFNKYLLFAYYVPGSMQGARNNLVNEKDDVWFTMFKIWLEGEWKRLIKYV